MTRVFASSSRAPLSILVSMLALSACAEAEFVENEGAGGASSRGGSGASAGGAGGTTGASGGSSSAGKGGSGASGSSGTGAGGTAGSPSAGGASGASSAGGSSGASQSGGSSGSSGGGAGGTGGSGGSSGSAGSAGSGGAGTCSAFSDDFEDGNATGWTESGGDWAVADDGTGNRVYEGGDGNEESWAGPTCGDQAVEARIKVTFAGSSDSYRAGIIARRSGGSSFFAFALGADGMLTLRRSTTILSSSVSGTCSAQAAGIDGSDWFTLRMEVSGQPGSVNIKTFLDGDLVHDCTTTSTSSIPESGQGGVLTYGTTTAQFDDVAVGGP